MFWSCFVGGDWGFRIDVGTGREHIIYAFYVVGDRQRDALKAA